MTHTQPTMPITGVNDILPKRKRRSRANPLTVVLRDLKVAADRLEKVRNGLVDLNMPIALEEASEMYEKVSTTHILIAEAWATSASKKARNEIISAYSMEQPTLPAVRLEA